MADDNVDIVRKGYEAFIKGDMETARSVFANDVLYRVPGRSPHAGDYHGADEVFEFLGKVAELTSGTFRLEIRDIIGRDENVVALLTVSGERKGKKYSANGVDVWRVENGKAVEGITLSYDLYSADEFWS
jgi:ketosteroid isomerase-like protein